MFYKLNFVENWCLFYAVINLLLLLLLFLSHFTMVKSVNNGSLSILICALI